MTRYILVRAFDSLIVALFVTLFVFIVATQLTDPISLHAPIESTPEDIERIRAERGFDKPVPVQYLTFLENALQGDFGDSLHFERDAFGLVMDRFPNTVQLSVASILLALVVAIPAGVISAVSRGTMWDNLVRGIAFTGQAMPNFWLALLLVILFGVRLGWLPTSGTGSIKHLVLPAVTLAAFPMASITRLTRSSMLEVLNSDYIRTAQSKGLRPFTVITRHALKNSMIPVITVLGLIFAALLGGSGIIEVVFAWPGVGKLALDAVISRDYPIIEAVVLLVAMSFIIINFLVDMSYVLFDPRIRLY
jgi:peptide/nickel transport system permease protein